MILRCRFTLKFVFIVVLTRFFCLTFEHIYVKTYEDTSILYATRMFVRNSSFRQYEVCSDMCYGFCVTRRQLTVNGILGDSRASVAM